MRRGGSTPDQFQDDSAPVSGEKLATGVCRSGFSSGATRSGFIGKPGDVPDVHDIDTPGSVEGPEYGWRDRKCAPSTSALAAFLAKGGWFFPIGDAGLMRFDGTAFDFLAGLGNMWPDPGSDLGNDNESVEAVFLHDGAFHYTTRRGQAEPDAQTGGAFNPPLGHLSHFRTYRMLAAASRPPVNAFIWSDHGANGQSDVISMLEVGSDLYQAASRTVQKWDGETLTAKPFTAQVGSDEGITEPYDTIARFLLGYADSKIFIAAGRRIGDESRTSQLFTNVPISSGDGSSFSAVTMPQADDPDGAYPGGDGSVSNFMCRKILVFNGELYFFGISHAIDQVTGKTKSQGVGMVIKWDAGTQALILCHTIGSYAGEGGTFTEISDAVVMGGVLYFFHHDWIVGETNDRHLNVGKFNGATWTDSVKDLYGQSAEWYYPGYRVLYGKGCAFTDGGRLYFFVAGDGDASLNSVLIRSPQAGVTGTWESVATVPFPHDSGVQL